MKLQQLPPEEKPREKLLRDGAGSLSNVEILTILLRAGTSKKSAMDIASEILALDPAGIRFLADCRPEELTKVEGVGDAAACVILAAVELGRRIAASQAGIRRLARCSDDIAAMFMESMRYYRKEHFLCLLMDSGGGIIEGTEVSIGGLSSTAADPREVFTEAIRRSAAYVILLHNHPSGDPTPSQEDLSTTTRLMEAGKLLGIPVMDHIIIGDGQYTSLRGIGAMNEP